MLGGIMKGARAATIRRSAIETGAVNFLDVTHFGPTPISSSRYQRIRETSINGSQ